MLLPIFNEKCEKLETEKSNLQRELLKVTEEKEKIDGERNLLKERSKTTKEEDEIKENIRNLIEEREKLSNEINTVDEKLKDIINESSRKEQESKEVEKNLQDAKSEKNLLTNDYSRHNQELISTKHKIDNLRVEIESGADMPNSVRKVLKNNELTGIYNTIGNVLSVDEKYVNQTSCQ